MGNKDNYKVFSEGQPSQPTFPWKVKNWLFHRFVRCLMFFYSIALSIAKLIGRRPSEDTGEGYDILLTGTFHSDNWISAHLRPLALSHRCKRLRVVSIYPVPAMENVELITPPKRLVKLIGGVPARMLTFLWVGLKTRPDVVGGFHLLFNGLLTALLAKLIGARSMYFCVGGPTELLNGGIASENRLFEKLVTPDPAVERRLLRVVNSFDLVITMGSSAASFFRSRGVDSHFYVVSGGLDASQYVPADGDASIDLIIVGRISPIKRMDIFLKAVKCVAEELPTVSAAIVGDGPLRGELEALAANLGIEENVRFAGQQSNIDEWLKNSKVFVLTSDSEGLSLALMEAMMTGLPAVVSHVGDLGDLVDDGVNGFLVDDRQPQAFAERILRILADRETLKEFSRRARAAGQKHDINNCVALWDNILSSIK